MSSSGSSNYDEETRRYGKTEAIFLCVGMKYAPHLASPQNVLNFIELGNLLESIKHIKNREIAQPMREYKYLTQLISEIKDESAYIRRYGKTIEDLKEQRKWHEDRINNFEESIRVYNREIDELMEKMAMRL